MNLDKLLRKKQRAIVDNNPNHLAAACKSLGDWYHENQEYEKALECYNEEAGVHKSLGNRLENSKAHRMIGEMYMLLEKFDEALKHELIYLSTAVEQNNKIEEQRAFATIGRVYLTKAQSLLNAPQKTDELTKTIKCAEKQFLKSLLVCKTLTDLPKHEILDMTARLYLNLGITYECKEEFNEAIKYFEKAMSICRHNDFWELLHKCYLDEALLYFNKLDDQSKALQLLNSAINIAERLTTDRTVRVCQTLLAKSEVLMKMADFQGAKQILHKAYKMKTPDEGDAESIETNLKIVAAMCKAENALITTDLDNSVERKKLYEKLGDGACKLKNFSAAIGYYKKMLDAAEKNGDTGAQLVPVYVSLYQTYRDMNEFDLALELMQKEYELCKDVPAEAFSTLLGIAETKSQAGKDFWTVDSVYEEARRVAQNMGSKKKEKKVLSKQLELREKYEMTTSANIMREVLKSNSFNASDCGHDDSDEDIDTETSEEINTPDVGDDICLDELSDSADENGEDDQKTASANTNQPRALRKRGCFTVKKNEKGESQLHRACISGNLTMARRLIDQGHPVNMRDHAGWLPLHEAANHGFTEIVELLLENGATINDKGGTGCEGFTPLHDACGNGVLTVVELLLNRGANATLKNDRGDTALQTLAKWRKDRILNDQEQSFYDTIYDRMYKQLEKAGVSTTLDESPSKNEPKTRTFIRKPSRNRIISDSSEDDSNGENRLPDSDGFDAIDSNLLHEFVPANTSSKPRDSHASGSGACADYRQVMSDLRKRSFQNEVSTISKSFKTVEKTVQKPAMLAPEEVSDDDWLDNDLEPSSKRRRYLNERSLSSESNKLPNRRKEKPKLSGSSLNDSMVVSSTNNIVLSDASDDENAFNVLMQSNQNSSTARRMKRRSSSSSTHRSSNESNLMMQSSLLESGFQRHRPLSPELIMPSSVSSTVHSPHKLISIAPTPTPIQSHSVKVQVSDLYLNIPVNMNNANDLTIEWLAEEAAKRYYGLKGVQPVLRLTTKDGAIFENSDPISLAFAENSTIASTVLEWIRPPLAQRYMETCAQSKTNSDAFIKAQIELIASTQSLSIKDQMLSPKHSRPLFKALHFQTNITKLDLTNSFIEDEGMKHLAQALPTMKQIISLNLAGNLITSTGIKCFSSIFDEEQTNCLPELSTLILNENPLQNQSLSALEKICCNLCQLSTLHLASTELTDLQNFDLHFQHLLDVDFSFNCFTPSGLLKAIDKLNSCKLKKLKLSFCGSLLNQRETSERSLIDVLTKVLDAGNCNHLEQVYLCGLNLNDVDCWQIVQSLKRSKALQMLSLRDNPLLTKVTWKLLLENLLIRELQLEGCKILLTDLNGQDEEILTKISQCCGNIKLSLNDESTDSNQFDVVKRIWNGMTHYAGKIFQHGRNIWLTTCPENVPSDTWEYVHT